MYDDMIQALGRALSTSSEQDNPLNAVSFPLGQLFLDTVFLSTQYQLYCHHQPVLAALQTEPCRKH